MSKVKVSFTIGSDYIVTAKEIAEAMDNLLSKGPWAYNKPIEVFVISEGDTHCSESTKILGVAYA